MYLFVWLVRVFLSSIDFVQDSREESLSSDLFLYGGMVFRVRLSEACCPGIGLGNGASCKSN